MKSQIFFFYIVFLANNLFSQEKENNTIKKNTLYFEFYQPIQTPAIKVSYNGERLLIPSDKYSRSRFSKSLGLCFDRELKYHIILRPRLGLTIIKVKETNLSNLETFNSGSPSIPNTSRQLEQKKTYNQKHLNFFFGIAKRFKLINRLKIDIGGDLVTIIYLNSKLYHYTAFTTFLQNTETIVSKDENWVNIKYGKLYCFGIGPYLKPTYYFSNNLAISLEAQIYFNNTFSKDVTTFEEHGKNWNNGITNGGYPYLFENKTKHESRYNFSQWGLSRLSPLIRVGYNF